MNVFDEAKQKIKESARRGKVMGYRVSSPDYWVRLSYVEAVLGDLQKTHLLVDREKLQELFKKIEGCKKSQCVLAPQIIVPCHHDGKTPMAPSGEPSLCPNFWDLTNLKELLGFEKAEKLLEPQP